MDGELGGRVFEGPGGNLQKCGRGKERGGAETKKIKKRLHHQCISCGLHTITLVGHSTLREGIS